MIRRTGRLLSLSSLVVLAGVLSVASANQRKPLNPNGVPKGYKPGATVRYGVWYDARGWHLGTATAGNKHVFRGSVEVIGGVITDIGPQHLEAGGKLADYWRLERRGQRMVFDFTTKGVADGVVFQVSPRATAVQFTLYIDNKAQPAHIYIGQNATNPGDVSFTLPAFPR